MYAVSQKTHHMKTSLISFLCTTQNTDLVNIMSNNARWTSYTWSVFFSTKKSNIGVKVFLHNILFIIVIKSRENQWNNWCFGLFSFASSKILKVNTSSSFLVFHLSSSNKRNFVQSTQCLSELFLEPQCNNHCQSNYARIICFWLLHQHKQLNLHLQRTTRTSSSSWLC